MSLGLRGSDRATDWPLPPGDLGQFISGLVMVAGGIAYGLLVVRSAYTIMAVSGTPWYSVFLRSPWQWIVLPVGLVLGWVVVGALLIDEHPLAPPIAAGAFLGATLLNLVSLGTDWYFLVPVLDPVTPVVMIATTVLVGPFAGPSLTVFTAFGTVSSVLIASYLMVTALRDPTVEAAVRAVRQQLQ